MKKLILGLFISATLFACKKDKTPDAKPIDLNVKVAYQLKNSGYNLPLTGIDVKITDVNTKASQSIKTDANGKAVFKTISAGTYDVDAIFTIDGALYTQLTGIPTTEEKITFNAAEKNKRIEADFTGDLELNLIAGKAGDWLIKQIYFAGSNITDGAGFRDQFIEFYNNTGEVLYADSLYFGQLWGKQSASDKYNALPSGQMDWSKSANMPSGINANKDYVYARSLFMIPGNGKQHPVQPGQSIVIAQTALNHKSPFTGNDGKAYQVRNPALTIDLSKADFEAYYGDLMILEGSKPFGSDIDNPTVPNIEVISYYGNDMLFDSPGRDAFVLFKVSGTEKVKNWPAYNEPLKAVPNANAKKFIQMPVKFMIDAVEIQANTPSARMPKKLDANLDAGFTFAPKGSYTSQSVIRKTEKTVNGRVVLKDTNNSTEDFDFLDFAMPKGFK